MSNESLKNLCECELCFKPYKDPRLLKCGHQFCEKCLKEIVKHTPQGHILCPACRYVTKPVSGDVTTLPRSTLHQYMQELIIRQPTEDGLKHKCSKCKVNKPTRHCPDCTADLANLCDKCFAIHQKVDRFAMHSTMVFDPYLVCAYHQHKMVENYCYDCNKVACVECLFNRHGDHKTENIKKAAEKSREVLSEYISKCNGRIIDRNILKKIHESSSMLQVKQTSIKNSVDNIKNAWQKLEEQLDKILKKMDNAVDIEMAALMDHHTNIAETTVAQEKMLKLAESLLGDVSDSQVIMGSRDLPEPDSDITEIEFNIPVIGGEFNMIAADIEFMVQSVNIKSTKEVHTIKRGKQDTGHIQKINDIHVGANISGVCFDKNTKDLIVRVMKNPTGPVKIYNTEGRQVKTTGQNSVTVAATSDCRQIAMDTKRKLYLHACDNGSLVRMEMDGRVRDTTTLSSSLHGVAYIPNHDLYVLSDLVRFNSRVFLLKPDTLTVVRCLGDKGTFRSPYNVCVGDINGSTTIVVSDYYRANLYLYDVNGEMIRKYGPEMHQPGGLSGPRGVSMDKNGCIVVCDHGNSCVLGVWSDKDGDHWECLLDKGQLGGAPLCTDIDNDNRLMAVSVGKTVKVYKF